MPTGVRTLVCGLMLMWGHLGLLQAHTLTADHRWADFAWMQELSSSSSFHERHEADKRRSAGPMYRGHDLAREAVRKGEAMPLGQVLRLIRPQFPGRILRVQFAFDPQFQIWVYDLRILQDERLLLRLKVDALTAEVLRVRGPHKPKRVY